MRVAAAANPDPYEAGRRAAQKLATELGPEAPHAIVLTECFEDRAPKQQVLKGVTSVFPKDIIFGFSTYGTFTQQGCLDSDSVGLLAIAGDGIAVAAALEKDLGIAGLTIENDEPQLAAALRTGGAQLVAQLPRTDKDRLLVLMADAHSPKNQFLVEGAQSVVGKKFPVTGGSANKNAGQTFVYYQGKMYADSAIALLLSGDFKTAQSGRQAKENAKVIATADDGAKEAMAAAKAEPFSVLAFNCAGRKGKLDNIEEELAAIQTAIGRDLPLFGAYCAGEIGPADIAQKDPDTLASGVGWHVMFTVLAR
jgi:hypothetical protein